MDREIDNEVKNECCCSLTGLSDNLTKVSTDEEFDFGDIYHCADLTRNSECTWRWLQKRLATRPMLPCGLQAISLPLSKN